MAFITPRTRCISRCSCDPREISATPIAARSRPPNPGSAKSRRCLRRPASWRSPGDRWAPARRCRRTCPPARQALIAREIRNFTAGSRSSKSLASSSMPESRSRPSVSCVRSFEPIDHAVEVLEELFGQHRVARNLAHHDHAQTIRAAVGRALQAALGEHADHRLRLMQGAHKRHHDLDVGQPHVVANTLERLALHRECLAELFTHVARCAAEAEHRVFFFGLVAWSRRSACGIRCS